MSEFQLKAENREKLGSAEARRIKKSGQIPAIIYDNGKNINISLNIREFEQEFLKGNIQTRIAEIELAGKKIKAITHKIELDPVSDRPIHVELMNCNQIAQIKAEPKLNFINQDKSPGLKKGGVLHIVLRKLQIFCENSNNIPEKIDIDAGTMQVGSKIRAKDLKLPAGVKLVKKGNFLVASIIGRGKSEEEQAAATAAAGGDAAAGAAPAAGAAAPAAGAAAKTPAAGAAKAPAGGKSEEKKK